MPLTNGNPYLLQRALRYGQSDSDEGVLLDVMAGSADKPVTVFEVLLSGA
jgi:hypothetical protein